MIDRRKSINDADNALKISHAFHQEGLGYLAENVPDLEKIARRNYRCFERYSDEHTYGISVEANLTFSCEKEAIRVLTKMLERHAKLISEEKSNETEIDECFYPIENAKIVREAEKYYRHMFQDGQMTWNIRDTHMCDYLEDLIKHNGSGAKAIIWAHNSHHGDARATESNQTQKINIGQLVRERFGLENTFNIGFITYTDTVTTLDLHLKHIRLSLNRSVKVLLHDAQTKNDSSFLLFRTTILLFQCKTLYTI